MASHRVRIRDRNGVNMNWLDVIILLPLVLGLIRGLMKGFVSEVMSILAIILGGIGARLWGNGFALWLHRQWAWPDAVCTAVAYALIFIGIAIALSIVAYLLARLFQAIHLGGLNRLAGGVFGMLKWAVVVLVAVFCVDAVNGQFGFIPKEAIASSRLYPIALDLAQQLWHTVTLM